MAYGESNGHVTDDPERVKLVTPIRLELNILKTAGNAVQQQSLIWVLKFVYCYKQK